MKHNLCSLSRLMDDSWKMMGDAKGIVMIKKGNKLVLNIIVQTDPGLCYCLYINQLSNELACSSITRRKPWSINDAHEQLGHLGKDKTCDIIKGLNLNVKQVTMETCWACKVVKPKKKNVLLFSLHEKSQVPGERDFLDLTSM